MTTLVKNHKRTPITPLESDGVSNAWFGLRRHSNGHCPTCPPINPALGPTIPDGKEKAEAARILTEWARLEKVIQDNDLHVIEKVISRGADTLAPLAVFKLRLKQVEMDEEALSQAQGAQRELRWTAAQLAAKLTEKLATKLHEDLTEIALAVEDELVAAKVDLTSQYFNSPSYVTHFAAAEDTRFTHAQLRWLLAKAKAESLSNQRHVDAGLENELDLLRWYVGDLDHAPISIQ